MYGQIYACWSPRDLTFFPLSRSGLRASSRCRTLVAVIGSDRACLGTIPPGFWTGLNKHPLCHLRLKKQSEIERYHRFCRCLCTMRARGRPNTRGGDPRGHRENERTMRQRVAHGVKRSGAPRRSRSRQPILDATPPPAPLHLAEALELGNLNRLNYPVVSPGWNGSALGGRGH